jgi:hypothetical protein
MFKGEADIRSSWQKMLPQERFDLENSFDGLIEGNSRLIEGRPDMSGISSHALGFYVAKKALFLDPAINIVEFRLGGWMTDRGNRTHNTILVGVAEDPERYKADPLASSKSIKGGLGFRSLPANSPAHGYFKLEGKDNEDRPSSYCRRHRRH